MFRASLATEFPDLTAEKIDTLLATMTSGGEARETLDKLEKHDYFASVTRIRCELFGSLAATGRGHHTDRAVIWGLLGE